MSSSIATNGFHTSVPQPMPHDAREYASRYSLTHFINAYYQVRDCLSYSPSRVLVVGVGVGLEPVLLRHKFGLEVVTIDIDPEFAPDYVGSVHDMNMFSDMRFDVAIASHVLEHLPFSYFRKALKELSRVSKHTVLFLPYAGRHMALKFVYAQRVREYSLGLTIPPVKRVTGERPDLQSGEHYWECGYWGYSPNRITRILSDYFAVDKVYHNPDWNYSINFGLTSKYASSFR